MYYFNIYFNNYVSSFYLTLEFWDLPFRRPFFDWEIPIYESFVKVTNGCFPSSSSTDKFYWCLDNSGTFSVKSLCIWVEKKVFTVEKWNIPSQLRKMIPPKVGLLVWQASNNKISSKQNLIRRGFQLNDNGSCVICSRSQLETSPHLFIHCLSSWGLWMTIFATGLGLLSNSNRCHSLEINPILPHLVRLAGT